MVGIAGCGMECAVEHSATVVGIFQESARLSSKVLDYQACGWRRLVSFSMAVLRF